MYLSCLISSIILIILFNKLDKKVSQKLKWNIKDDKYELIWMDYQEGRQKIYKILCLLAFIPFLNFLVFGLSVIVTLIFLGLLISEMNFWNKLF